MSRGWVLFASLTCCGLVGCGGDGGNDDGGGGRDRGPSVMTAEVAYPIAFEGQREFVTVLSAASDTLDDVTVRVEDPDGPLELVDQRCAGPRCGVVIRVRDVEPSRGIPVPSPIDASNEFLRLENDAGDDYRSLLSVQPLDAIRNTGTSEQRVTAGTQLAASAELSAEGSFVAASDGPMRWVVLGPVTLDGAVEASAMREAPGSDGWPGGDAGAEGMGPGGGDPGTGGAGAGGGGHASEGEAGEAADGTAGGGGAGGAAHGDAALPCLADFGATECGGSGGGGAAGAGGGGGGAVMIVSLQQLDLSGATVSASGGEGQGGGGGGAGGAVLLAGPSWSAPDEADVAGGAGGAPDGAGGQGGAGAEGFVRVDVPGADMDGAWMGPAVDVGSVPRITDADTVTLEGTGPADATIEVGVVDGGMRAGTTADGSGAFAVDVPLEPGLNRLTVRTGEGIRSWVGTSLDLQRFEAGEPPLPVGAVIDVAHVP